MEDSNERCSQVQPWTQDQRTSLGQGVLISSRKNLDHNDTILIGCDMMKFTNTNFHSTEDSYPELVHTSLMQKLALSALMRLDFHRKFSNSFKKTVQRMKPIRCPNRIRVASLRIVATHPLSLFSATIDINARNNEYACA